MPNRKNPLKLVYTVPRPPIRWGSRLLEPGWGRPISDVMPTDIRITMPGYDFDLARRQLRRYWERRPRKWRGMPICGFWLMGHYGEIAFCYLKLGDYESINMTFEEDIYPDPDDIQMEGWKPGEEDGPAYHYVDPNDLARYPR